MPRKCKEDNVRPKPKRNTDWVDILAIELGISKPKSKKNKYNKVNGGR